MNFVSDTKQIFIVGSSRSGTTMMGRILGNSSKIFTFRELHFFGSLWTNKGNQELMKKDQVDLLSKLLCIQEHGLFHQNHFADFHSISESLIGKEIKNPLKIYRLFLKTITEDNGAKISCEQTPQNLYYLDEILRFFPNAKVINLVRDQRDVLLSQKNKWRRRFLGAKEIPISEALRSYFNYHPLLTAKVWNSSLSCTTKYINHPQVKVVKFENLLSEPEDVVKDICSFLKIDFQDNMLKVPVMGSSTENDSKSDLIIDSKKINKWKKGGLSKAEIYLSQKMSSVMMGKFGYEKKEFIIPPLSIVFYLIFLPLKLGFAFLLNISRTGDIIEVIKKRFFIK